MTDEAKPELRSKVPYLITLRVVYDDETHGVLWAAYAGQQLMGMAYPSGFYGIGATPEEATRALAASIHEWAAAWRDRPAQEVSALERALRPERHT